MDRITILGMGPLGVSIGLALKRARLSDTEIMGTDGSSRSLAQASKMGAIDKSSGNLRSAMQGASLVIMDTPYSETREFMEAIGPLLKQGCTVTDTGPVKVQVKEWAKQFLPSGVSFVGGRPLPLRTMTSLDEADATIFDGTSYCVVPDETTDPESVRTVAGMVEAIRAKPVFMSPEEHDSYAAAMSLLPIALSAALVTAVSDSPGWRDMAKVAGAEFNDVSRLASTDPRDNAIAFLGNPGGLVDWLGRLIEELGSYRDQIKSGNDEILESLIKGWEQMARLESGVAAEENALGPSGPTMGQSIAGMVVGRRLADRGQQIKDLNKHAPWRYPRRS